MPCIYRCDACKKERPGEQPNMYIVEPTGWFATFEKSPKGGYRRTAPYACSSDCVKALVDTGISPSFILVEHKAFVPKEGKARIGRENCKVCRSIKSGEPCLFHRPRGVMNAGA